MASLRMTIAGELGDLPVRAAADVRSMRQVRRWSLILTAAVTVAALLPMPTLVGKVPWSEHLWILLLLVAGGAGALGLLAGVAFATRGGWAPILRSVEAGRRYGIYWRDATDGLFTVRVLPDGDFVYEGLNPAHEALTGLKHSDLVGRRPQDVLPPEIAAKVSAHYRECLEKQAPITYAEALELPGGLRHWETSLAPVRGADGAIELLLGSARDVTDRATMQAALLHGEERFRAVTELVPDILFTASLEGVPDYVSPRFFDYTGLPGTTRGLDLYTAIHPEDAQRIMGRPSDRTQPAAKTQIRIRGRDGAFRWFLIRVCVVEESEGPTLYGVAADIDDVKRSEEQISALNHRLTSVLSSISDCYYTIDRHWRITSINPKALEWFDHAPDAAVGADMRHRRHLMRDVPAAIREAFETGRPVHLERDSTVRRGRWVEIHIYPSPEGASIFFRDITERRIAQRQSEVARVLLQGSLDAMGAQIALLDETGMIIAVNKAWADVAAERGLAGHGIGRPYVEVCHEVIPELAEARVARGVRALLAGRQRTFRQSYVLTTPEGVRWRHLRINQFRQHSTTRLIAMHEDVTEIARAQAALRETSERLLMAQEEERQRIAVELHDSTSQHLVALGLGVTRLRRNLRSEPAVAPLLDDMSGLIGEALKEIRVFSYLLNPPNLERDGLEATLRRFVSGFGARTGLTTLFRPEGDLDGLDPLVQRAVFRVIQEALANVHRHAEANGAEVDLAVRVGELVLRVADDGRGLHGSGVGSPDETQLGVGIPSMRARVLQLGGTLSVTSDEAGAVVEARVPLAADHEPAILETEKSR
jgi:PAS domain S-box-containing protein